MNRKRTKVMILFGVLFGTILLGWGLFKNSYAFTEPIQKISFDSELLDYNAKEPGSVHIEKSAKWISTNRARITFDIDTIRKNNQPYKDVILVLDISSSMEGNSFNQMKKETSRLLDTILNEPNNSVSLISFADTSEIDQEFTKDKDTLTQRINALVTRDETNYYQALRNVEHVLENYEKKDDTECIVVFLTDGAPSKNIPNQISQYTYLKEKYPYVIINAVQYEMGDVISDSVKKVSDYQYIASKETLGDVLLEASNISIPYDKFILTDTIDNQYFEVISEDDIRSSIGDVELISEDGKQKVRFTVDHLPSGKKPTFTIDIRLKDDFLNQDSVFSTNQEANVIYAIGDTEEKVTSTKTPRLASYYLVSYEGNFPNGCTANNVPDAVRKHVYDLVEISDLLPSCDGYQFNGWKMATKNTYQLSDDYFEMPEHDVLLRAEWSKLSIVKSMDGSIYVVLPQVLQSISDNYNKELWKYKDSITRVVFLDTMAEPMNTQETWDISDANDGSVIGRIALNDGSSDTYTAYIQGDGGIIANSNSRCLFSGFSKLKTIEGLEYFDTSNTTNMRAMFADCKALTDLDLSNFDTSNVVNMNSMFADCNSLTSLNISSFNTKKVTDMSFMFENCQTLSTLDLSTFSDEMVNNMRNMFNGCTLLENLNISNFKTENVANMSFMFDGCSSLTSLDLSNFNTSKVESMRSMFEECKMLTDLNLSNFDTSHVTDMGYMFTLCNSLTNLNISTFDTSNVITMWYMFSDCASLTILDLSNFDTSKVTNMRNMFFGCTHLLTLDVRSFNTENVEDMSTMFYECSSLTNLDMSSFYTPKVTRMKSMFQRCSSLKTIDLSNFNTSKVINMSLMFSECSSLTSLDLGTFNAPLVEDVSYMFHNCSALTELIFGEFNTQVAKNMAFMFARCSSLTNLDLSGFVTLSVTDMSFMFYECNALVTLDISSFRTPNVTTMKSMFHNCNAVTALDVRNFDTSNVTTMGNMFYHCDALTNLDVSGFNFEKVTSTTLMFYRLGSLTTTVNMNSNTITDYSQMFARAATDGTAVITVNYTSENSDLVDSMIATKSSASNVVKGELIS